MTDEMKKMFEEMTEKIRNMPQEEFERDILCLNGMITVELFDKVIEEVNAKEMIEGGNDCWDYPKGVADGYSISSEEFADVYYYIQEFAWEQHYKQWESEGKNGDDPGANRFEIDVTRMFDEHSIFFIYKGIHYVWNILNGQGSVFRIWLDSEEEYKKYLVLEMGIDPSLRFFKRLK